MDIDFKARIEGLNAGEPIPEVDAKDLGATLRFFADLRGHPGRHLISAPGGGFSFLLDDLAQRCSDTADPFAVALRGMLLQVILNLDTIDVKKDGTADEFVINAIAKIPLVLADLNDPDAVRRRAFDNS